MTSDRSRQMKYLWAVGILHRDAKGRFASKPGLSKTKELVGMTRLQAMRQIGKIGKDLKPGEISSTHMFRVGYFELPLKRDKNGSTYPVLFGKMLTAKQIPEGEMSLVRIDIKAKKAQTTKLSEKSSTVNLPDVNATNYESILAKLEVSHAESLNGVTRTSPLTPHWEALLDVEFNEKDWYQIQVAKRIRSMQIELATKKAEQIYGEARYTEGYTPEHRHKDTMSHIENAFGNPVEGRANFWGPLVYEEVVEKAENFFKRVLRPEIHQEEYEVRFAGAGGSPQQTSFDRSHFHPESNTAYLEDRALNDTGRIAVHEAAHAIDFESFAHQLVARDVKEALSEDRILHKLSDLTGNPAYDDNERATSPRDIGETHPYVLKEYPGGASEVFSMGLDQLYTDSYELLTRNPLHFKAVLTGLFLPMPRTRTKLRKP